MSNDNNEPVTLNDLCDYSDEDLHHFLDGATDQQLKDILKADLMQQLDDYSNSELYDGLLSAWMDGSRGYTEYTKAELEDEIRELIKERTTE